MKLQTQITIAFTTLLVIIMSVVSVMIYSLILDVLIQNEREQLQEKGDLIKQFLWSEVSVNNLAQLIGDDSLQLFLYDQNTDNVMLSTLPKELIDYWLENYDVSDEDQRLWKAGNERYVVSIIPIYPNLLDQQLILVTPLDDLQEVQRNFFNRLIFIFLIGIGIISVLSHFLTKRLVTPLTKLKYQLKKIEKRKFDDLERVHASGEMKEVEQSVYDMANELSRYIQSQHHFFQNASHELKTPLMTIQGYAEGIRDGVFEDEASDRGLDVIVAEISRLKKIINEMILLAKLDSEENIYDEENVPVANLIHSTIDRALPLANEKQVRLTYYIDTDANIAVDKEKLLQAMMNVVSNGIRHANGKVIIRAFQENKSLKITVADDGKGIDEALMPKLFQRFMKGKSGETGLGLAISRAIVERSNGTITAGRSELGGALFTITFKSE
ncbi:sensor histidine kinase RcsC [Paraliobacillus ryukyuensis]|uniref:histidine kinase n=1 Tax=Paraliobacillus ryukyuensis TaxID=200904 RepID=A0A366EBG7_9BACI|nr:HAMP domain-containing sensor histidine kinase [Paraliobacillus ryukyuensis]RBO99721.1 signal transduction histidine kinase [Paraliobacillus ryukyuensis]